MANNIVVSDANDVDRTLKTTDSADVHTPHHIVDSSGLPTGASTSSGQTTTNSHLATIAGDTTSLDGKVTACNTGAVVVSGSALPTGASTEATLNTLNGKVTACNTGAVVLATGSASVGTVVLGTGSASVGTVVLGAGTAGIGKLTANSGVDIGDVDVTSLPSLPAGTNGIGKLTANSGVDIGDVDVTSVAVPTAVYHGKKTVTAGTDEVIASSQAITSGITVKALAGNAGIVYVGVENVAAATGFELSAKESVFIECDNVNRIWIDAATGSADGITYIAS